MNRVGRTMYADQCTHLDMEMEPSVLGGGSGRGSERKRKLEVIGGEAEAEIVTSRQYYHTAAMVLT